MRRDGLKCLNLVGPQIRKLRYIRGWSQNHLATKLQLEGWDIDRVGVAKIESRLVHIDEFELLYFIRVFNVSFAELFPKIDPARRIHEVLTELMQRRAPGGASPHQAVTLAPTIRFQRRTAVA